MTHYKRLFNVRRVKKEVCSLKSCQDVNVNNDNSTEVIICNLLFYKL